MKNLTSSVLIWAFLLLCVCGCSSNDPSEPDDGTLLVNLGISVSLADISQSSTRSGEDYSAAENDNEKMKTLRIVIVRPFSWIVEANEFVTLETAALEKEVRKFKVKANEKKQIYLFVNENATVDGTAGSRKLVEYDFNKILPGSVFPLDDIYKLKIRLDNDNDAQQMCGPLPMCEYHEYMVTREPEQSCSLFVTRGAVKFTFNIINKGSSNITLDELMIDKMAREEWYMPRAEYAEGDIDGDKKVLNYHVPEDVEYYTYPVVASPDAAVGVEAGTTKKLSPVYLLEGKYAEGDRKYTLDISIGGIERVFDFPNLEDLPRNTHVVVNITYDETTLNCVADVRPYTSVVLNPDFGLKPKTE